MNLRDLFDAVPLTGGEYDPELEINSISSGGEDDLRGCVYVQLPDSPLTARQALEQGAAAAVCAGPGEGACLCTPDVRRALALLAANLFGRPSERMTLIVVVGGTDARFPFHLLRCMLQETPHARVGAIAPDGAWIGGARLDTARRVPGGLCVQRLLRDMAEARCTHAVLLLDDGALERRECAGLHPAVTALTAPAADAGELGRVLSASDMVVFNLDERGFERYRSIIPGNVFTYSEGKPEADLVARSLRLFPGHTEFEAVSIGRIQRIHLPVPGAFALYHALCVIACGTCLGLDWERMACYLRCARGPRSQMEILQAPAAYTVVLDQAETPRALERLLACAREVTARQLICVLRCPDAGEAARSAELGGIAGQMADQVILARGGADGPYDIGGVRAGMAGWDCRCTVEPDRQRAVFRALECARAGDVIVLAGCSEQSAPPDPDERELVRSYLRHRRLRRGRESADAG